MKKRNYPNGQPLWDGEKLYYSNGKIAWANKMALYPNESVAYVNHCGYYKNGEFLWRRKIGYDEDGTIFSKNGRFAVKLNQLFCLTYDEHSVSVIVNNDYNSIIVLKEFNQEKI